MSATSPTTNTEPGTRDGRSREGISLDVFSACPASPERPGPTYLETVRRVAGWSDRQGCRGMLVYADNGLVDPWLVSQVVSESTEQLSPLVAVNPVYMHPYAVATMVATLSQWYSRKLHINWVAGGFKNDLIALGDEVEHDARYDRLLEYATIVRRLTDGGRVTLDGDYYRVRNLSLKPSVPPSLRPGFLLSGSSEAGRAAARALEGCPVTYAQPPEEHERFMAGHGVAPGVRLGIIARDTADEAWRIAYGRFPPDREGALTREMARKVSDSRWHERLCELADERAEDGSPYWMVPFENYKTMCPYLVGSHEEVADILSEYVEKGFRTYILDEPQVEEDLKHAWTAFDMAQSRVQPMTEVTA